MQLAATEVFTSIAKEDLLPIAIYTQHFLRTIITNMNAKDPGEFDLALKLSLFFLFKSAGAQ